MMKATCDINVGCLMKRLRRVYTNDSNAVVIMGCMVYLARDGRYLK